MEAKTLNRETQKQNLFNQNNIKPVTILYSQVFRKEGYVNIIKMFDYIKGYDRGQLFRFANDLAKDVKGKWFKTFDNNTTKDYIRFCNFMKIYNPTFKPPKVSKEMRNRKFAAQALDDYTQPVASAIKNVYSSVRAAVDLPSEVKQTLEGIRQTALNADNFFDKANVIQETMISAMNKLAEYTDGRKAPKDILIWIFKVLAFINLLRVPENREYLNLVALFALILPAGFGERLRLKLSDLALAIQGVISRFVSKFTTQADEKHDVTIITVFFRLIRDMFVNCFTGTDKAGVS